MVVCGFFFVWVQEALFSKINLLPHVDINIHAFWTWQLMNVERTGSKSFIHSYIQMEEQREYTNH
jgi:hypothetical protein